MRYITNQDIDAFVTMLRLDEKAEATIRKYVKAAAGLWEFLAGKPVTKENIINYRQYLQERQKAQTVNGNLTAVNTFLDFLNMGDCKVKLLKVQRRAFLDETKELTEAEYRRLLAAAEKKGNRRLQLLMMTLCSTGIRISELSYITVETAKRGRADISLKGKYRTIILPKGLCRKLLRYAAEQGIGTGCVFRTRTGRPVDRSNVCHDMKKLCRLAKVDPRKVFPHNLRHLFARCFYAVEKNLVYLADILGHSRLETTKIYIAASASAHEKILQKMYLLL